MALVTIEGVYRNGQIELAEIPGEMEGAKVIITFLPSDTAGNIAEKNAARERLFARMDAGINFGGEKFNRAEIYEERLEELEARRGR